MLYTYASIKAKKKNFIFNSNRFSRFRPQILCEKKSSIILLYVASILSNLVLARNTIHSYAK